MNTAMIAKMPIVIPSNDKIVRNRFTLSACRANVILSRNNVKKNIAQRYGFMTVQSATTGSGNSRVRILAIFTVLPTVILFSTAFTFLSFSSGHLRVFSFRQSISFSGVLLRLINRKCTLSTKRKNSKSAQIHALDLCTFETLFK